jgi:hypothetical protein
MPIEIRELVIRATVSPAADRRDTAESGGNAVEADAPPPVDVAAIVQECVRQVLQVLARERER